MFIYYLDVLCIHFVDFESAVCSPLSVTYHIIEMTKVIGTIYHCYYCNDDDDHDDDNGDDDDDYYLTVKPTTPTLSGPNAAVGTGITVTLTCSTTSLPPGSSTLTYAWLKGTTSLSEQTSQLVLDPTSTSDTGVYTCTVTYNSVTSDASAALSLTVQGSQFSKTNLSRNVFFHYLYS